MDIKEIDSLTEEQKEGLSKETIEDLLLDYDIFCNYCESYKDIKFCDFIDCHKKGINPCDICDKEGKCLSDSYIWGPMDISFVGILAIVVTISIILFNIIRNLITI